MLVLVIDIFLSFYMFSHNIGLRIRSLLFSFFFIIIRFPLFSVPRFCFSPLCISHNIILLIATAIGFAPVVVQVLVFSITSWEA